MRKYNFLFLASVLVWLVIAVAAGCIITGREKDAEQYYKVEISRIMNSLSGEKDPDGLNLRSYKMINRIEFLPAGEADDRKRLEEFCENPAGVLSEIRPWYEGDTFKGYLKFEYVTEQENVDYLIITELALAGMECLLLSVLFHLRKKLVQPFYRMNHLTGEMSKGHLKAEVKEENGQYFGEFVRGIGRLKDALETSRKRQLELEKEKKMLLLSLSHDVMTPLNTIALYAKALEEGIYTSVREREQAAAQIGKKAEEIRGYVEEIVRTSRENILDIRVEQGEFYLAELMNKVLDVYREKCGLRMIDFTVAPYTDRLLKGDLERAVEVLENIFENAFKYGDGRRIEVTFEQEDYCQLIRVFSTGNPVTENEFNHIFESFFRGSNSEGKQGSGLGLYVCREIMKQMDGAIFARKEEDGMAFVVVFR